MNSPDSWIVVKIFPAGEEPYYKLLCGWSGSYVWGSSWKLNSGITKVEKKDNYYLVHGQSGSVYKVHKDAERISGVMFGVLHNLLEAGAEQSSMEEFLSVQEKSIETP